MLPGIQQRLQILKDEKAEQARKDLNVDFVLRTAAIADQQRAAERATARETEHQRTQAENLSQRSRKRRSCGDRGAPGA